MHKSNYHTHSDFCDGRASVEAMIDAACALGYDAIGFSGHAPLPFRTHWTMTESALERYLAKVHEAKKANEGRIKVYLGLEIDYIDGMQSPADDRFAQLPLDYSLGALHYLRIKGTDTLVTTDGPQEEYDEAIMKGFGGDAKAYYRAYYRAAREMIGRGGFDILAHLDVLRKGNGGNRYFSEDEGEYRDEVRKTLDAARDANLIVEINTGGVSRGKTDSFYPSDWVIAEMSRRGIRVCVNADAHAPEHMGHWHEDALKTLSREGYKTVSALFDGEWREVPIEL
jgi:histidinol-phosphatase (PHP family)